MRRFLILFCLMGIAALQLTAQSAGERMSFRLKAADLKTFVRVIEERTDYKFIYGEDVSLSHPITLEAKNEVVATMLKKAFADQPVVFQMDGKHIILKKKTSPSMNKRKFTISGYIVDDTSRETLLGASVIDLNRQSGTVSNSYGFYSFTLDEGEVSLGYSYLGYAPQYMRFSLDRDTVINVKLGASAQLDEVLVVADRKEAGLKSTTMGAHELRLSQLTNTPAVLGETDVLRTIQLLPGVNMGTEGFSGILVRGGGMDENLVLLDGSPVYNPNHLLGIFSIFTPEAVKKVTLFKSSFPARYGGRLSSVVDVRTNDGDMQRMRGLFSIGLLSQRLHLEGPLWKNRTTFSLSGRFTGFPFMLGRLMGDDSGDEKISLYFYDLNAKLTHRIDDRNRLFLGFYNGEDRYQVKMEDNYTGSNSSGPTGVNREYQVDEKYNDGVKWGNTLASLRWNHVLNNRLFSNTTVAYNHYQMKVFSRYFKGMDKNMDNFKTDYTSGITDWSLRTDFDFTINPRHELRFGYEWINHHFTPESRKTSLKQVEDNVAVVDTTFTNVGGQLRVGNELSLYAEDNAELTNRLSANVGVHFSYFNTEGKNYLSLQPRLSVKYKWSDAWSSKVSYSKMSQYIHLLSSSSISLPTDLWVPITKNIRPMNAHQISLGTYFDGLRGWEFSLEGYYKQMNNVLEYKEGTFFFGSSRDWENNVSMGKGRAYGAELMVEKTEGRLTGWFAYTLAKSERRFPDGSISNGEWFPHKFDRRHNVKIFLNYQLGRNIDLGATWLFNSGNTMTVPERQAVAMTPDGGFVELGTMPRRNNYRLPSTHTLNLNFNWHIKRAKTESIWNLSIYNVLNRKNPTLVYVTNESVSVKEINPMTNQPEIIDVKTTKLKKFTLLPFIPSISYTLKF